VLLKLKFEGQLHGAGAADLVERVEAAIGTAGAQAVCQRLRRVAEQGAGQTVDRIPEVRVIENVEELSSEPQPHFFSQLKLALQAEIGLHGIETTRHVAAKIALLAIGLSISASRESGRRRLRRR